MSVSLIKPSKTKKIKKYKQNNNKKLLIIFHVLPIYNQIPFYYKIPPFPSFYNQIKLSLYLYEILPIFYKSLLQYSHILPIFYFIIFHIINSYFFYLFKIHIKILFYLNKIVFTLHHSTPGHSTFAQTLMTQSLIH